MALDIKTEFDHAPRAYLTYLIMDNLYSAMVHNFKSEFEHPPRAYLVSFLHKLNSLGVVLNVSWESALRWTSLSNDDWCANGDYYARIQTLDPFRLQA